MQNFTRPFLYLLVVVSVFVSSCNRTNTEPTPDNQFLVSSSLIGDFSREQLIQRVDPTFAAFLPNGIKVYKIVYKTKNTDGKEINASGAVMFPNKTGNLPLISVQHGTITDDREAPSYYATNSEANAAGSLLASQGFIVAYPDYIGYGASNNLPHPYEHRESLASASLDMLRATREFVRQEKVAWDNRLYIAGYSEGGFATLALQKKIEEETGTEFNLRASSCGSGAYDKTATMKYLVNSRTTGSVSSNQLYLWVLLTYDRIYNLNRPTTAYFKAPWAAQIQTTRERTNVNVSLNTIFTDAFIKGLNDGTDTAFLNAIKDNDVYDWKPRTPTRLYHGDADDLVFYFNSVNAEKAMKARGATNVTLIPLRGRNHTSGIQDFLLGTFDFFSTVQ
jgi:pimeloyl-ACP methyl ester carboxylesterase